MLLGGRMDSLSVTSLLWAFILVLPVILTAALCISCRKKTPTRILQSVDDYVYKSAFTKPPTSFTILRGCNYPPQNVSSSIFVAPREQLLSIPSMTAESRRSSVGMVVQDTDSLPSYENELKAKDDDDDIDDNYSNENYICGYIEVLPDDTDIKTGCVLTVPPNLDSTSASVSSATIADDGYENVEQQRSSLNESLEYVNVPSLNDIGIQTDLDNRSGQESEDDSPDYENVVKNCQG
ncbi:linker for activation of T-cells family member 1 isoform X2 [Ascaphus truei]|uniref:linker for activation of T-cells family member 1 isoform X2 n=1 Tax=Ascaphus truei TaxID=8439 RepID=UPI003F597006